MLEIVHAESEEQVEAVRSLFSEYAAFLGFDLSFQGFEEELAGLPGEYSPPRGRLTLALWEGKPAGCVAFRAAEGSDCEMKRLFVRAEYRGKGIGKVLAEEIIEKARQAGYRRMLLDTVPALVNAIGLYRSLGFVEVTPYRYNPIQGATFWALDLVHPGMDPHQVRSHQSGG